MKKQFYSHLVTFEAIRIEMRDLNLSEKEQEELIQLATSHMHHVMLDESLSRLHADDKKIFLEHVHLAEHDKAWALLRSQTTDIERHLLHAAHILIEELRDDMRELKKKNK